MPITDTIQSELRSYRDLWRYRFTHHRKRYITLIAIPIALIILYLITHLTFYFLANHAYNQFTQGHTLQSLNQKFYDTFPNDHTDLNRIKKTLHLIQYNDYEFQILKQFDSTGKYDYLPDQQPLQHIDQFVTQQLDKNASVLTQLREFRNLGPVQFIPEFSDLPVSGHADHIYEATNLLFLRATQHLHHQRTQQAFDDILLMIQLSNTIAHIPRIHESQYSELIYRNRIQPLIDFCLQRNLLDSKQLRQLQEAIQSVQIDLQSHLRDLILAYLLDLDTFYAQFTDDDKQGMGELEFHYYQAILWEYSAVHHYDRYKMLTIYQQLDEQIQAGDYQFNWLDLVGTTQPVLMFYTERFPPWGVSLDRVVDWQNIKNTLIRKLAAARYQLDHEDAKPISETQLIPDYLDEIPPVHQ